MTQIEAIRLHLLKHGSINPMEAWKLYGCYRLSDVIFRLRGNSPHSKFAMNIITEDVEHTDIYGEKKTYANYVLKEEEDG